ncbi:BspA family leucine-rich repeat surface protein [Mycoplasma cottewii]|uniref:BspA family leucine-rich repeat surface protein n=1 Tax=Mycoplasma cottewii TaxID=51364 RepID=A0ABY5TVG9_9MOLU|nr:BspA family leucine-rich repeat surface protein [Mycoplasma cottewii]UWD34642.1 BspA family leucine-rich repeat surface protein [Mycoplasma cottewii]
MKKLLCILSSIMGTSLAILPTACQPINTQKDDSKTNVEEQIKQLKEEQEKHLKQIKQLNSDKVQLEKQLQTKKQEINDYQEMIQKNGELTKLLGDEIVKIEKQYDKEVIENQQVVEKITKALEEYVKLIEKYQTSSMVFLQLHRNTIAELNQRIESKDLKITDLTHLNQQLTNDKSSLESELSSVRSQNAQNITDLTEANRKVTRLEGEISTLRSTISQLEQDKGSLETQLNNATQESARTKQALEQQISQLTQQLQQKETEFQREKQRLESELGSKTTEIQRINTELSTLSTRAGQLETQNQELNRKWEALNTQFTSTKQQLDTVTRERNTARQELSTANSNLASVRRTLEQEQQKFQRLEAELNSIKGNITSEQEKVQRVWNETIKNTAWENETYSNLFNRFNKELNKRDDIELKYKLADNSKASEKVKSSDKELIIKNNFTEIKLDLGKVYALKQDKQEQDNELKAFGYDENGKVTAASKNINKVPEYLPWFITDLTGVFEGNASAQINGLEKWNTENVTNMTGMFSETPNFNQSLNHFDTSKVTDMNSMFANAEKFDGDISSWDTSNVTNMAQMFDVAKAFNQDISAKDIKLNDKKYKAWDVSRVKDMNLMFAKTEAFNQNISNWDTLRVEDMSSMFEDAKAFNQDISSWNVNNVKNFKEFSERAHDELDHTKLPKRFAIEAIKIELTELFEKEFKNKITSDKTYKDIFEEFKSKNKLQGVIINQLLGVKDINSKPQSHLGIRIEVQYKTKKFEVVLDVGTIK